MKFGRFACRVCRSQLPTTPVKDFEHRIELAFFYLITVAFIMRLNQVFDNTEPPADDTLALRVEATEAKKEFSGENSATERIADVADVRGRLPMPVTAAAATKGIRLV